jgi:hypothetical protein
MGARFLPRGASLAGSRVIPTEHGAGLAFADGSVLSFNSSDEVGDLIKELAGVQLVLALREQGTADVVAA